VNTDTEMHLYIKRVDWDLGESASLH